MSDLFLDVSCVNEHASDGPNSLHIKIDAPFIERVKQLVQSVKELNVYAIETFYNAVSWSDYILDREDENYIVEMDEITNQYSRIDVSMLIVLEDSFYFTGIPKHCGDDQMVSSSRTEISALELEAKEKPSKITTQVLVGLNKKEDSFGQEFTEIKNLLKSMAWSDEGTDSNTQNISVDFGMDDHSTLTELTVYLRKRSIYFETQSF